MLIWYYRYFNIIDCKRFSFGKYFEHLKNLLDGGVRNYKGVYRTFR